ncbi:hypothetical protein C8R43DRAFT_353401 [Mycena crocata]|nr:hypothetical protein C8R43DRAFT_353401 [Mycena crocata]
MPVSFPVANHPANSVKVPDKAEDGLTGMQVFSRACWEQCPTGTKLHQFSLGEEQVHVGDSTAKFPQIIPHRNGLVYTIATAYTQHHMLQIRPDDVWLAILCQFNFFINANAELFRASFVAHEGKRELVLEDSSGALDFGSMARRMADLLDKNVVDTTLRDWALPAFSTTTETDTTVGAVLLMATLKHYFKPVYRITGCGIPRVTLLGERADWEDILGRSEKLKEYGLHAIAWYHLLQPVLSRFVAAFDAPESPENVRFWERVVDYKGGSGLSYYSGWINAFNVFNKKGEWLGTTLDSSIEATEAPESLSAPIFWATYAKQPLQTAHFLRRNDEYAPARLVLDGTPYHRLDCQLVPPGYAEVDVTLHDVTAGASVKVSECAMVAGLVGMRVTSSAEHGAGGNFNGEGADAVVAVSRKNDTVSPVAGWWFVEKKAAE